MDIRIERQKALAQGFASSGEPRPPLWSKVTSAAVAISTALALSLSGAAFAADEKKKDEGPMSSATFAGMKLRSIGPAFMAGRISDIEIVPSDKATWYVGVGSGGVWKTTNAGTTWTPLFDKQSVYSIGELAIDPQNHNTVWVGTGENVGGRHLGFGDGIYVTHDGGKSWKNMGLKKSEHISEIIVHPNDSHTIWAAAQGPLWSKGGERGLFKSTDGGKTWENKLSAGEWTGVTDVVIDPRNPDRLYAATWQRHRTVAAYAAGGPETAIYKSEDGGETWNKLTNGLPKGNMGKIGLAVSPINPDVVYAAIELDRRKGAVYRSSDRGASWVKGADAVAGGTGPHYYQELYASPHKMDRIYLADVRMQVSDDGGKTFRRMKEEFKHSDNHALAFRDDDPDYLLVGSDGGIYESYDLEQSWRFIKNLPITQFYKVAVDDKEPFYQVYGGTQDNNSQGGPSRTDNIHGIRNSDWFVTLFGDGHQSAIEPGNPNIMYAEWQQGNLVRVDRTTGEIVYIKPFNGPDEPRERFNWDAPILVSAHDPKRVYFASQRVWRTDNRGDDWKAISGDITNNVDRMQLPLMGRKWSWDAGWDFLAMSEYSTITSLAESPKDEDILYAGTDDGLIQATTNGGESWTKIEVGSLPGVPETAFVNDIKADLYDAQTVYVALDNHKFGDYKPYLLKSTNGGRSWTSITGEGLGDKNLIWRVVQDHENKNLMFAGTEFGVFFTVDGGQKWVQLKGGVPTIPFRDLAIQRRENDLVGATFGRGFYILDDYSPLRKVSQKALESDAVLMTGRPALWYLEQRPMSFSKGGSQGHDLYRAENPPFGAVFTYYLKDGLKTLKDVRQEAEKPLIKDGKDTPFPGYEAIDKEVRQVKPEIWLTISDMDGKVISRVSGPTSKGMHRVAWNLTYPPLDAIGGREDPNDPLEGLLAAPGKYQVTLTKVEDGKSTKLAGPETFEVKQMRKGYLEGKSPEEVVAFWKKLAKFDGAVQAANATLTSLTKRLDHLKKAVDRSPTSPAELDARWHEIRAAMYAVEKEMRGPEAMRDVGDRVPTTVGARLQHVAIGTTLSTYGPTPLHLRNFEIARSQFKDLRNKIETMRTKTIPEFEKQLQDAGAPWTPGSALPPVE
ncbi:MAG: glycosyl hydrolase [Pseudomonadota bacterium]